jgi:hypothetical protein
MAIHKDYQRLLLVVLLVMLASAWIVVNDPDLIKTGAIYFMLAFFAILVYFTWKGIFGKL